MIPAMRSEPLTVWCNLKLPERAKMALEKGLEPHRLLMAHEPAERNQPLGRPDPYLFAADVVFGQPEADQCLSSSRLEWVHLTSAGYTTFAIPDVSRTLSARGIPVTASSSVYEEPCAQHALAFMLADARQLPRSARSLIVDHSWETAPTRAASFLIKQQAVLLVGYGAIAKRLTELLAPFGLLMIGFRRNPVGHEAIRVEPVSKLDHWLPLADFVVNILPASVETEGFFDAGKFNVMKPGAVFINIGRGSTVDQGALSTALHGRLRAAYLDVTWPEPLPTDHPLWLEPNCFITPHVAGGHEDEFDRLVALFLSNLENFLRGKPLVGRVY
jgi:phosphoglycerate dehydrogenase-like enzyme